MISISIVVPVYNVEEYIHDCIKSICSQTYNGNVECIFVDDCGTDESIKIVQAFLNSYSGPMSFKLLHHKQNRGLSAARNTGLDAATGEYVYFLDSDDAITPSCLSLLTKPLEQESFDFVIGDYNIQGIPTKKMELQLEDGTKVYDANIIHAYSNKMWPMTAWNKLCRREFLLSKNLRFKEGLIHEDELWSFQLACAAKSMCIAKEETYIYNIRENSITTANTLSRKVEALNSVIKEMVIWARSNGLIRNKDVHNTIERFRIDFFCIMKDDQPCAKEYYYQQRKETSMKWWECLFVNGFNLRAQVRDLHFVLPPSIGYYLMIKIIKKSTLCK